MLRDRDRFAQDDKAIVILMAVSSPEDLAFMPLKGKATPILPHRGCSLRFTLDAARPRSLRSRRQGNCHPEGSITPEGSRFYAPQRKGNTYNGPRKSDKKSGGG
jgi:hypothetical protein